MTSTGDTRTRTRTVWARWGGGGITAGGVLLLMATVVEATLWAGDDIALVSVFATLFVVSAFVPGAAMIPLAGGDTGNNGIVGTSWWGRAALLGFGAVFMSNQTVYLVTAYSNAVADNAFITSIPLLLAGLQLVLLVASSISIVRARVTMGAARWAFPALTVVAVVTGVIASSSEDVAVVVTALVASCLTQVIVGVVLLTAGSAPGRSTV